MSQRLTTFRLWVENRATVLSVSTAIVCAVFTGLMYFHACSQSKKALSRTDKLLAIQNRPLLKFEKPDIFNYKMETLFQDSDIKNAIEGKPTDLKSHVTVKTDLKAFNDSSSVANLIAECIIDRCSGYPALREMLFDPEKRDLKFLPATEYFLPVEILPHTEHTFQVERKFGDADLE